MYVCARAKTFLAGLSSMPIKHALDIYFYSRFLLAVGSMTNTPAFTGIYVYKPSTATRPDFLKI